MGLILSLASAHIEVVEPESVVGRYMDRPLGIASPADYFVNALVAAAASCPCQWLWSDLLEVPELAGLMLLIPDDVCAPSCTPFAASCAASLYNMSGVLVSENFASNETATTNNPPPSQLVMQTWMEAERLAYARRVRELECIGLPGSFVSSNTSGVLLGAVNWTVRTPLPPTALEAASEATTNASYAPTINASAFPLPPSSSPSSTSTADDSLVSNVSVAWTTALGETALNVSIRHHTTEPTIDCSKYRTVPLVYAFTVPLWAAMWASWVWQTYHVGAMYAKDLHRLMTWVPIMETVHGMLSLINYLSCPWTSILSLVSATFWSIVTILKEPVILLCLLLVAKGWCITRLVLSRREVCVAGSILALLYASVSVQMSLQNAAS